MQGFPTGLSLTVRRRRGTIKGANCHLPIICLAALYNRKVEEQKKKQRVACYSTRYYQKRETYWRTSVSTRTTAAPPSRRTAYLYKTQIGKSIYCQFTARRLSSRDDNPASRVGYVCVLYKRRLFFRSRCAVLKATCDAMSQPTVSDYSYFIVQSIYLKVNHIIVIVVFICNRQEDGADPKAANHIVRKFVSYFQFTVFTM